ncbi:protein of unknown function [Agreia sp. COWG]|nr:protein of unknown function [Agreia sp. COWG]
MAQRGAQSLSAFDLDGCVRQSHHDANCSTGIINPV